MIAAVLSSGKASMHELSTSLSVEDCYMILDVITVDAYNQNQVNKYYASKRDE